jgi:uncharacterized membrane protein YbjE (DUF340 family)
MIAVLITFMVKSILAPKRIEKKEVIAELGYDVMIMCVFGLMLDAIGSYSNNSDKVNVVTYSLEGFICAIVTLFGLLAVLFIDKLVLSIENDPYLKTERRYKWMLRCAVLYIVVLVCFVTYGIFIEKKISHIN